MWINTHKRRIKQSRGRLDGSGLEFRLGWRKARDKAYAVNKVLDPSLNREPLRSFPAAAAPAPAGGQRDKARDCNVPNGPSAIRVGSLALTSTRRFGIGPSAVIFNGSGGGSRIQAWLG